MQIENWKVKEDLKYDGNNFWVALDGQQALIGLTDYGQWVIGDILYIQIGKEGATIHKGESFGSVESGKWVGNLIAPVSGRVLACNNTAVDDPHKIQADPYGTGWLIKVELASDKEVPALLNCAAYVEFVNEQVKNAA